jgi:hypothetical protein
MRRINAPVKWQGILAKGHIERNKGTGNPKTPSPFQILHLEVIAKRVVMPGMTKKVDFQSSPKGDAGPSCARVAGLGWAERLRPRNGWASKTYVGIPTFGTYCFRKRIHASSEILHFYFSPDRPSAELLLAERKRAPSPPRRVGQATATCGSGPRISIIVDLRDLQMSGNDDFCNWLLWRLFSEIGRINGRGYAKSVDFCERGDNR